MNCPKCGNPIPDDAKVCPNCGESIGSFAIPSIPKTVDKEFILKNINTILAVVSIVLMLLPMLTINAYEFGYGNRLSISGFEMASGMTLSDGSELSRNFFAWLMVMVPIFSVLTNYIKKLFSLKKIMLFVAPLICTVCLFLAKSTVSSSANVSLSTAIGFWLYLIVCLFWLVVGFLQYKNLPLSKESISKIINQKK